MRERAAEREVEQKKQVPTTAPVSTQKEVATQQQKVAASNPITQQAQTSAKPTPTQTLPQRPEQQPYTFEKPINYDEYYENINQKKQIDENYLKAKEQEIEYREKELKKKYPILPTTEKKDDNIWSLENLEKHQLEYDKYNVESERVKKEIENHTLRKDIISIYEKEYNKTHRGAVGRKGESVIYDSDLKNPFYRGTQITIEQTIERTLSNPDFLDKAQKFAIEKVGKDEDAKRIKKELENADKGMDNNTFKNQLSKLTSKELEIYNRELEKELIKYNAAIERVYSQVITQSQDIIIDHLRKQNVPEGHIEYILKKGFSSSGIGLLLGGFNKSTLEKQLLQEGLNEFDAGLLTETLATVLSLSIDGATGLFIPGAIVGGLVSKALLSGAKKIALGRIKNLVANKTFKMITTNVAPNVSKFTQSAFSGSGSFSFFAASKEFANQVYQGNGYDFYAIGDAAKKDAILGFLVGGVGFGTGMLAKKINNHVGQVAVKFGVGVPLEAAVFVSPEVIEGIIAGEPIDSKENAQYFIDMAALMVAMRVKHFKGTFGKEINNNNNIEFNQSDIEQINKVGIDGSNFTQMVKNMFRGDKSANNELNLKNLFPNVDKVMRDENVSHETKRKLEYLFYAGNYYEYNKELLDKTEKDIINGSKNLFRYVPQLGDEAFDKTINELRIDGEYLNYILDKKYSELTEGEKIIYKKYRQSLSECVIKYKELNNAALDYAINENIDLFPKEIQSIIYKENLNEVEIEILKDFLNNIYKREDNGFLNEKERKFLNDLKEHLNFTSDAFERLTSKALNGIPIEIKREDNRIDIFDVKGNVVYSKDFENKETADKYEKAAQKMYLDTNGEFQQKINKLINEKTTQTLQITLELCSSKLENGKIIIKEGKTQGHEDMPDGTSVFVIDEQNNFCLVRYYEKYAKPNEQGHKGVFKERIIHKDNIKDLESRNVVDIVLERLNKESELLGKTSIATMEATINVAAQEGLVEIKNFTDAKEGTVVDVVDIDNNIKKGTITKNEQGQNVIQFSDGSEPITDLSNVKTAIKKTFNGKEFIVSSIEDGSFECKMSEEAEANEFIKKFNDSDYSKEYDAKVSEDKETVIISEKKEKQIDTGRQNIINSIIEKINGKRHNELTEEEKDFLNNPDNKEELNAALAEEKELEFIKKHPDGYIDKAKQQQQIERLTEQQAEHFIAIMEENAENAPVLEFTPKNWYAQFGEDGMVKTPIGDVKMGENQYLKMQAKGRSTEFGMVKPTLENPDVVLEEQSREGAIVNERETNLLFIKTFTNSSGEKYIHFESVTVSKDKKEVVVSSHIIKQKQLLDKLKAGRVVYTATALDASSQTSAEYTPHTESGAPYSEQRNDNSNIAEKEKFYESLPKNKKTGEIYQNKMSDADVLQYWEYEKGKEYAFIVAKQRKEKLGKELEKEQKTLQNDLGDIKQNAKVEKLKAEKAVYDDYITEIAKQKEKQQKEKHEERKEKNEKKHEKEQSKTQQEALIGIEQQWNDAPKIYGRTITITLPNGQIVEGQYVLSVQGAATPSHNPKTFESNEGFVNENGNNINDRDYTLKGNQSFVEGLGVNYTGLALENHPKIIKGVVVDGNNRVMSGELAAEQKENGKYNDEKYITALEANKDVYGYTSEDIESMKNNGRVRSYIEIKGDNLPVTTETFALFNARTTKSQNKGEQTAKFSKMITEDVARQLSNIISDFETLEGFYNSTRGVNEALRILTNNGAIDKFDIPQYTIGGVMSPEGKSFFENVLVGSVLNENAIKAINDIPFIRQTVVKAIHALMENKGFSEDYSLMPELNDAVIALAEAYKGGVIAYGENAEKIFRQGKLYDDNVYDAVVKTMTQFLNESKPTELKNFVSLYNSRASLANAGQADLALGRPETKQEIIKDIYKNKYNAEIRDNTSITADIESTASGGTETVGGTDVLNTTIGTTEHGEVVSDAVSDGGLQGTEGGRRGGSTSRRTVRRVADRGIARRNATLTPEQQQKLNAWDQKEAAAWERIQAAKRVRDNAKNDFNKENSLGEELEKKETSLFDTEKDLSQKNYDVAMRKYENDVKEAEDAYLELGSEKDSINKILSQKEQFVDERELEDLEKEYTALDNEIKKLKSKVGNEKNEIIKLALESELETTEGKKAALETKINDLKNKIESDNEVHYQVASAENSAETVKGLEILKSFFDGKIGLLGSVKNTEIGDINIYSGYSGTAEKGYKDGHGLEHIIAQRWTEGNNVVETLFGINDALSKGKVVRDYGGEQGRVDLQYGDYIAVISKQRFGEKEQWTLTGYKIKSDAERESYNPNDYAPYSSVSRNKVVADFAAKVQKLIDNTKFSNKNNENNVKRFTPITEKEFNTIIDRLKQTGLAKDVITDPVKFSEALENVLGKDDAARFMSVWHGSPYLFDKFSSEHIGSGEGNQSYGYGLYFTDKKSIAESYAKPNFVVKNKNRTPINYRELNSAEYTALRIIQESNFNKDVAIRTAKSSIKIYNGKNVKENYKKALDLIINDRFIIEKNDNGIYQVKIHGDKTSDQLNFIRWDKPLTKEHREIVKNIFNDIVNKTEDYHEASLLARIFEEYDLENQNGWDVYNTISHYLSPDRTVRDGGYGKARDDKAASEVLLKYGIDGIQYPTEYQSKGQHEKSYNYVVFDDKAIEIKKIISGKDIRFMATRNGEVYGFVVGEKIYIDGNKMNANTPIHEFAHLWNSHIKENNTALWNKGIELIKNSPYWEKVNNDKNYSHLSEDKKAEEAIAMAIGDKGEQVINDKGLYEKLTEWLNELWKYLCNKLGLRDLTPEQIQNLTLEQFTEGAVADLLSGERINENSTKIEEAKQKIQTVLDADKDTSIRKHEKLFEVSPEIVEKIKKITGIDVGGYKHSIDKSEINHTINQHGNVKIEESRGQIAVTEDDFLKIPEVIEAPDGVKGIGKDKMGRETVVFEKTMDDGSVIVYEAILTGQKELAFQTLFKKKPSEFMQKSPTPTSETTSRFQGANVQKLIDNTKFSKKNNENKNFTPEQRNEIHFQVVGEPKVEDYEKSVDGVHKYFKDMDAYNAFRTKAVDEKLKNSKTPEEAKKAAEEKIIAKKEFKAKENALDVVKEEAKSMGELDAKLTKRKIKSLIKEMIYERRIGLNLGGFDTNEFIRNLKKTLTNSEREAIPFIIEGKGILDTLREERPDIAAIVDSPSEKVKNAVSEIENRFDTMWKKINNATDGKDIGFIDEYITHIWDLNESTTEMQTKYNATRNRYLKQRIVSSIKEGMELGLVPKTLDVADIMQIYEKHANDVIYNTKFIKFLEELNIDGEPVLMKADVAPNWYVRIENIALEKYKVHPDVAQSVRIVFGNDKINDKTLEKIVSSVEVVNGLAKKMNLSLSLFHHGALTETAIASSGFKSAKTIFYDIPKAGLKSTHPAFINPELTRDAILHGVQLGATSDIPVKEIANNTAKIRKYLKDKNIHVAKELAALLDVANSAWDRALWDYLHDGFKIYGYEQMALKVRERGLKKGWNEITIEKQLREVGQLINDVYGGQNWDVLGVTPMQLRLMRFGLLSPDWLVSSIRQALAPFGIGKLYNDLPENTRTRMGIKFWVNAAIAFGVGMNALNYIFRKRDEEEQKRLIEEENIKILAQNAVRKKKGLPSLPLRKNPYDEGELKHWYDYTFYGNTIGHKTHLFIGRYDDGREKYLRWGKQFRELPELLFDNEGFSIPYPALKKIAQKSSPIINGFMQLMPSATTLSGFENKELKEAKGWRKSYEAGKTVLKMFLPYSVSQTRPDKELTPTDFVMPSSTGMSNWKAINLFMKGIKNEDYEYVRDVYTGSQRNGLNAVDLLKTAAKRVDSEKAKRIVKELESIIEIENAINEYDLKGDEAKKNGVKDENNEYYKIADRIYNRYVRELDIKHIEFETTFEDVLKDLEDSGIIDRKYKIKK